MVQGSLLLLVLLLLPFTCHCRFSHNLRIETSLSQPLCRNTVQGRFLLADDNGYICGLKTIDFSSGCCPKVGQPFQCNGCNLASKCCNSYEYCVACCLNPERTSSEVAIKVKVARQATAGAYRDLFDFCLGRCRHDSGSVVHENAYATEEHHCFSLPSNLSYPSSKMVGDNSLGSLSLVISRKGESCEKACKVDGQVCQSSKLSAINKCSVLQKYFSCKGACVATIDQPAEVSPSAPRHLHPGACVFATQESALSCQSYNPHTRRLCPCG